MHPTVKIPVALQKNNLAKPQHIGGACVKWIPPNDKSKATAKNNNFLIMHPPLLST
jgi:hypothetical protein